MRKADLQNCERAYIGAMQLRSGEGRAIVLCGLPPPSLSDLWPRHPASMQSSPVWRYGVRTSLLWVKHCEQARLRKKTAGICAELAEWPCGSQLAGYAVGRRALLGPSSMEVRLKICGGELCSRIRGLWRNLCCCLAQIGGQSLRDCPPCDSIRCAEMCARNSPRGREPGEGASHKRACPVQEGLRDK